jgi:hypothetical protein
VPDTPESISTIEGCTICSSPTGDSGRLCRTHTDELLRDLNSVPDLVAELDITRTRQARITAEKHGGRSAERPLPWNEHAAARAFELNATLNAWALDTSKLAEDERDRLAEHHHADTSAVARWLARNIRTLRQHQDAGQASDEITDAIREARRAIDRPLDQEIYGKCMATLDGDDALCEAYLYATHGKTHVICPGCGSIHDTEKRRAWMFEQVRDMLGNVREVVACLKLGGINTTEDRVRSMATRGRFLPRGINGRDQHLYRVSEVLAAIEDRYRHRKAA